MVTSVLFIWAISSSAAVSGASADCDTTCFLYPAKHTSSCLIQRNIKYINYTHNHV